MEPQDDPEERIRELERPLADTAHASELGFGSRECATERIHVPAAAAARPGATAAGTGPRTAMAMAAHPRGMAPRSSSGNRVWWILAAVFVVGVLAVVGIVAASVSHRFSRRQPRRSVRHAGHARGSSARPGLPREARPLRRTPSVTPLPPQGAELTVTGINENQALDLQQQHRHRQRRVQHGGDHRSLREPQRVRPEQHHHRRRHRHHRRFRPQQPSRHTTRARRKISKSGDGNVVQQG